MAIFSLNHKFIGRSTHAAGSASLFARYITRPGACTETLGQRMPTERGPLMNWLDDQEQGDRKNARVIDKVVVALPAELSHEQNLILLSEFGERMTEGRAAWMAAIHDGPEDADNPHAHMIFRDRDPETGRRLMLTTEKGSTQRFRDAWEQEANIALERAGFDERIDKRSLKDQGIEREPQLHVGPGAEWLAQQNFEFQSSAKEMTRLIDGVPTIITVDYTVIDEGKTRFEENELRKQRNLDRDLVEHGLAPRPREEAMDCVNDRTDWMQAFYEQLALKGEVPAGVDGDAAAAIVVEHIVERKESGRDIGPESELGFAGDGEPGERGPRKDASDLIGGVGLAIFARISQSLESLFDPAPARQREGKDEEMADKQPTQKQTVDLQQRAQEAELASYRKQELDALLKQRDRERHIDRGR